MKKLLFLLAFASSLHSHAQLVPNGNSGSSMTSYTNAAPNDPIYIWCGNTLGTQQGSLTATPTSGTGPYTFNWFYHNQVTSSWQPLSSDAGATSTISNLASDGYRVEIYDASNMVTDCFIAWVWNLNTEITASSSVSGCNNASLSSTVNTTGSFSYYNPPPPQSFINVNTEIQVCFSANHTYVSDLAFYLVSPSSCGSTLLLSPNPGAIGQDDICNSGDNVNNLCFNNMGGGNLDVCDSPPSSLGGSYSSYGPSSTPINWSSLIGCNAAGGGWAVQVYDCIGADFGSLTNATITFSNLTSVCGSPTTISYGSGAINSAINDGTCDAATASIFQVPVSPLLSTPITITATTTLLWNGAGSIADPTSGSTTSSGLPAGVSTFILTATTTYGNTTCTPLPASTSVEVVYPTVNAGPDQTVCLGESVTLSGSGAQTYTWDNGVTNGVSFVPASTATYTVTGASSSGCTDTDRVTVTVNPLPTVDAGSDQTICLGMPITLSGSGAQSYTWDNGVTDNVSFTPSGTQTYTVIGTDVNGCQDTSEITITVVPAPVSSLSSDVSSGMPVLTVEFYNNSTDATDYSFDYGNGQSFQTSDVSYQPTVSYSSAGVYTVILTAGNGICYDTSSVVITVFYNPLLITVPNIFTPDGDGVNDQFFITLENATSLEVTVTNRWGNRVASFSGVNGFWDGKVNGSLAEEGVYFYNFTATGLDGTTQTGQGNIQLVRD